MPPSLHARLLAACAASYAVDDDPSAWDVAAGFTSPPATVEGGLRHIDAARVGTSADGVVVAFRGTLTDGGKLRVGLDWAQDLLAAPIRRERFPGEVHAGFHRAWTRLEEGVIAEVRRRWSPGTPLWITGHSKGGSLASLAAWALRDAGYPCTGVVTFAAAHVGDAAFAAAYDAVIAQIRYENHLDLVPFVPPTPAFAAPLAKIPVLGLPFRTDAGSAYAHVGTLRYITEGGAIVGDEPGLAQLRVAQIAASAAKDEGAAVLAAHTLTAGYRAAVGPAEPAA